MAFINLSQLTKAVKGLINKINLESNVTNSKIGQLSNLNTTNKDDLVSAVNEMVATKQNALISGTNIKTVNGNSLVGSGDLVVGGSVSMTDTEVDAAVDAAFVYTYTITNNAPALVSVQSSASVGETVTITNIYNTRVSIVVGTTYGGWDVLSAQANANGGAT